MRNPAPYSIPPANTAGEVHTITVEQRAHLVLAVTLVDYLDDLPSGEDGSRQEQMKDSLRAELDALLDTGADLTAFADHLGLDTGELPLDPPIHLATLSASRATALATARALSAEVVSRVRTGQVA